MAELEILVKCVVGMAELTGLDNKFKDFLGLGGPKPITLDDIEGAVQALLDREELKSTVLSASTALSNARDAFKRYESITSKPDLLNAMQQAAAGDDPYQL